MLAGLLLLLSAPLFVLIAPLVVLPTRAVRAAGRNCFRSDKSFSRHRAGHELKAIADLGQTMLVVCLLVVSPLVVVVLIVHTFFIPVPLAAEAAMTDFRNSAAWEQNPRRGPYEGIAQKHERFVVNRGGTVRDAHSIQKTLWRSAPGVILIWFASIVGIMGWMCRLCSTAFCEYHKGLRTRTMILSNKRLAAQLCLDPSVAARRHYLTGS
jgi:hypothetical protein